LTRVPWFLTSSPPKNQTNSFEITPFLLIILYLTHLTEFLVASVLLWLPLFLPLGFAQNFQHAPSSLSDSW